MYYGIIFNVFSLIVFVAGITLHQIVIVQKQEYSIKKKQNIKDINQLNNDIEINNKQTNDTTIIKRRLSKYIEQS